MDVIDEENIFLFAGFIDYPDSYKGAIGVYDYFWKLTPEVRENLIRSWETSLDSLREKHDVLEELAQDQQLGSIAVFTDDSPVEIKKPRDNVVPFKR